MSETSNAPTGHKRPPGAIRGRAQYKRPTGAYKLLTELLYGRFSFLERTEYGAIRIHNFTKMGQRLNVPTAQVHKWILWLEDQGFLESLAYTENKRACQFKLRRPPNI